MGIIKKSFPNLIKFLSRDSISDKEINLKQILTKLSVNQETIENIKRTLLNNKLVQSSTTNLTSIKFKSVKDRDKFLKKIYDELYRSSKHSLYALSAAYSGRIKSENIVNFNNAVSNIGSNAYYNTFDSFVANFNQKNGTPILRTKTEEEIKINNEIQEQYKKEYKDKLKQYKKEFEDYLTRDHFNYKILDSATREFDVKRFLRMSRFDEGLEEELIRKISVLMPKGSRYENGNFYDKKGKILERIKIGRSKKEKLFNILHQTKTDTDNKSLLERFINSASIYFGDKKLTEKEKSERRHKRIKGKIKEKEQKLSENVREFKKLLESRKKVLIEQIKNQELDLKLNPDNKETVKKLEALKEQQKRLEELVKTDSEKQDLENQIGRIKSAFNTIKSTVDSRVETVKGTSEEDAKVVKGKLYAVFTNLTENFEKAASMYLDMVLENQEPEKRADKLFIDAYYQRDL